MIYIDRREPEQLSKEIRYLGVETSYPTHLDYGDLMFEGNGEMGEVMIALERKKLGDLINSMQERRLSGHQARGLWETYEYVFLIVEGMWRPGPGGEIQHFLGGWKPYYTHAGRNAVNYRQVASYLHSMSLRSRSRLREPMRVIRTATIQETAAQVVALYKNFTDKKWDEHSAHDQIYAPLPMEGYGNNGRSDGTFHHRASLLAALPDVSLSQPTLTWAMAAQLPGLDRKAQLVAEHFKTPVDMILAGLSPDLRKQVDKWFAEHRAEVVKAWAAVKTDGEKRTKGGKRKAGVGKAGAERIVEALLGR